MNTTLETPYRHILHSSFDGARKQAHVSPLSNSELSIAAKRTPFYTCLVVETDEHRRVLDALAF